MIFSIGTDVIEIERIKKASLKRGFLCRVFSEKEILMFEKNYQSLAGNFAVKEAVVKAFGTGFRGIIAKDIEVLRDELGKPYIKLYNSALKFKEDNEIKNIHVSISHNKTDAIAFVVMEK